MVCGELGRYLLDIYIKLRTIKYWAKLVTGKQDKLPAILCNFSLRKYAENMSWLKFVKSIFDECGLSNIYISQQFVSVNWLYIM